MCAQLLKKKESRTYIIFSSFSKIFKEASSWINKLGLLVENIIFIAYFSSGFTLKSWFNP